MAKIAIVTDSTAYIPPEVRDGYQLFIVPLQVNWGDDTYRDGIDITPLEFYTRLQTAKIMPTTSQPSPAAFQQVYQTLLDQDYDIISVHISQKLSGTLDSAYQARDLLKTNRITIIDSMATSMSLGFPALLLAREIKNGASLDELRQLAEKYVQNTGIMFVVSTLEFLRRGGRIGGATAFLGTALGLKPLLELKDGLIEPIEKIRTMAKATDRMLDLLQERIGDRRPIHLATLHANAPQEAEKLLEKACQRFNPGDIKEAFSTEVSPVVGTHAGPGTVGICYLAGV